MVRRKTKKGNSNVLIISSTNYIILLSLIVVIWIVYFALRNNIPYATFIGTYRLLLLGHLHHHYYYNPTNDQINKIPITSTETSIDDTITTIPPIIHHFAKYNKVPQKWLASYSSTLSSTITQTKPNVKYTFKLWSDEQLRQFIKDEYSYFLDIYDSYPYEIQRVDAARYFVLRKYGGIYIDLDIGCRHDLTDFITSKYGALLPKTAPLGISNDLMFATPSHPFFVYVTENLYNYKDFNIFLSKFLTVMLSTGSMFLSLMLYKYKNIVLHEQLNNIIHNNITSSNDIMLLNNIIDVALISRSDYEQNYFYHLPGNSWQGLDGKIVISIWSYKYTIIVIIMVIAFCKQAYIHGDKEKVDEDYHSHNDNV